MSTILGVIEGVEIYRELDPERVIYTAKAAVDADGSNGQNGAKAAYRVDDKGSEALANGGMKLSGGKVICAHDWARDIVILGPDGQPREFPGGIIASMTWYRHPGMSKDDPAAYVDSETVPYAVVPPLIVKRTKGIVRGCKAIVTYKGQSVECVVADLGPANRIGELSIAAARALGIPSSPRNGGVEEHVVRYEIHPGVAAKINGMDYTLQPS